MNTENLSLLISVFAVAVAALALGWNIYRDVILKAKVKVSLDIVDLLHPNFPDVPKYIRISVANFGPGRIRIMSINGMNAPWWKRILATKEYFFVMPDSGPLSAKLPAWIEQGDKIDLLLPHEEESFLKTDMTHVGVIDFYGRSHWAPSQDIVEARRIWKEAFQKDEV